MSFKPEVIADSSGRWCGNALRFATREEAEANVQDLLRGKQDENTYCLTEKCSRDVKRCLTKHAPVA